MAVMAAMLVSNQSGFSYFYLYVTPMLPTKFQVNWPFVSGVEEKNRFSRWPHGHLGFLIGTILAIFDLKLAFGL